MEDVEAHPILIMWGFFSCLPDKVTVSKHLQLWSFHVQFAHNGQQLQISLDTKQGLLWLESLVFHFVIVTVFFIWFWCAKPIFHQLSQCKTKMKGWLSWLKVYCRWWNIVFGFQAKTDEEARFFGNCFSCVCVCVHFLVWIVFSSSCTKCYYMLHCRLCPWTSGIHINVLCPLYELWCPDSQNAVNTFFLFATGNTFLLGASNTFQTLYTNDQANTKNVQSQDCCALYCNNYSISFHLLCLSLIFLER